MGLVLKQHHFVLDKVVETTPLIRDKSQGLEFKATDPFWKQEPLKSGLDGTSPTLRFQLYKMGRSQYLPPKAITKTASCLQSMEVHTLSKGHLLSLSQPLLSFYGSLVPGLLTASLILFLSCDDFNTVSVLLHADCKFISFD